MSKFKSFLASPAFLHGLLAAAQIAVAIWVKNPTAATAAETALGAAASIDPQTK